MKMFTLIFVVYIIMSSKSTPKRPNKIKYNGKYITKTHYRRLLNANFNKFKKELHIPKDVFSEEHENVVVRYDVEANVLHDSREMENFQPPFGVITSQNTRELSLRDEVKRWSLKHNLSLTATTSLLKILKSSHSELPIDARSLLRTRRNVKVELLPPGYYYYFGIANELGSIIKRGFQPFNNTFLITINIDGLPLFGSSHNGFWPILGCVEDQVFIIATYFGPSKPKDVNSFLNDFVDESCALIQGKLCIEGRTYDVRIVQLIADLPAKSYILCIKGHSGYSSCTKCCTQGAYVNGRVCFPELNASLRTHEDFIEQADVNFHRNQSNIIKIPKFNVVTKIPIDYMHAICLGITKKLINLWTHGSTSVRINAQEFEQISKNLNEIRKFCPSDFQRKPRSITEFKLWKSVEFRQFLLYIGPFVIKDAFKERKDIYNNFVL